MWNGFVDKEHWTFGIEMELPFWALEKTSEPLLTILNDKGEEVICLYGDMANEKRERRLELVTAPLYIGDEAHQKNMRIVAFLLNAFSQAIGITVEKKDFVLEFSNYVKGQSGDLKKFTCTMTRDLHITSADLSGNIGRQITFGFPYNEMDEFFENLKPLWYENKKYKCGKLSDPNELLIYNYIVCVLAKYKDFYSKQEIIVTTQGKNEWGIMPRRSLTELTKATETSEIWSIIKESDFFNDETFRWAYNVLHNGGSIGGHISNLNTKFDKNGHQLIFECRSVPDMLLQYFDYDPIDISLNFKDKFEKNKEDAPSLSEPW